MQVISNRKQWFLKSPILAFATALLGLSTAAAFAGNQGAASEIQARYVQERARCMDGTSNQDRATCLKEAGAARAEARRGLLEDGASTRYRRNAKTRCEALRGDEAADCLARMDGHGTTSGSAEAGGISRELRTREVMPAGTAASASPAR